jgi:uncharacterized protein (TIGR03000 family)
VTYGWPTPYTGCAGCVGYGYGIAPSFPYYSTPAMTAPNVEVIPPPKKDVPPPPKSGTTYVPQISGQASVTVKLPADAKLYADGLLTTLTSSERTFVTPILDRGRDFQYTFKVEYQRSGQAISDTRKVVVRADAKVQVDFTETRNVETASSKVTVALPQGAKLFVDGEAKDVPPQGQFQTPELVKGAEYVYTFKAELNKQTQTQRVVFKAGQAVRVDFMDLVTTTSVTQK